MWIKWVNFCAIDLEKVFGDLETSCGNIYVGWQVGYIHPLTSTSGDARCPKNQKAGMKIVISILFLLATTDLNMYLLYCVCIVVFFTLDAGLLARSQYSEGPAIGHLDTGFSRFPCVYKQMLRWFPTFQVATTCFSCCPPELNLVVTDFMFCLHVK